LVSVIAGGVMVPLMTQLVFGTQGNTH